MRMHPAHWALVFLILLFARTAPAEFSVEERRRQFLPAFETRLKASLARAGLRAHPVRAVLVFYKDENLLHLYAGKRGGMKLVKSYPVLAASGTPGPKLREGDEQVPEGIYGVEALNPNSRFHVSLRVGYPNVFDRAKGKRDGRANLGGDIMIHGNSVSLGCIALGDQAIEELFYLAATSELPQWKVILAPTDLRRPGRRRALAYATKRPAWLKELYAEIEAELKALPE